jgi:hypothetical protein
MLSALREKDDKDLIPSGTRNIWFIFSLVAYFESCQQPHILPSKPQILMFVHRVLELVGGKGGHSKQTD